MFSKRNQTPGNDLMLLEKCGRRVPLDSQIRKWVKQAIIRLNSFRVKHWKNDDVKLNVSEMQPNSWKSLIVVRNKWEKSFILK